MDCRGRDGPRFLQEIDWPSLDMAKQTQEDQERLEGVVAKFFAKYTKEEIYRRANKEGVLLCPQSSCKDILENTQLQSRDFWAKVEHPELGTSITYPGPFLKATRTPPAIRRRAPLIGEHNAEVYKDELGLSEQRMAMAGWDRVTEMHRDLGLISPRTPQPGDVSRSFG